jgi:hypothetical protein
MKFRTTLPLLDSHDYLASTKILGLGSCFAVNVSSKLKELGIPVSFNPFGLSFNPITIAGQIKRLSDPLPYGEEDLQTVQGLSFCYDFHSDYSSTDSNLSLTKMNESLAKGAVQFAESQILFLTFGTSFTYTLKESGQVVANCHKQVHSLFTRSLVDSSDLYKTLYPEIESYLAQDSHRKVIVSVSPVRHLRDHFQMNQVSKAQLVDLCYRLTLANKRISYFPAYELLLDDLRDYRFYEHDMVHPNSLAQDYIFERFVEFFYNTSAHEYLEEARRILTRIQHRPLQPDSDASKKFQKLTEELRQKFALTYPWAQELSPSPFL